MKNPFLDMFWWFQVNPFLDVLAVSGCWDCGFWWFQVVGIVGFGGFRFLG